MTSKIGPLRFRVPISAMDRAAIASPETAPGNTIQGWPEEALVISGIWPAPLNRALTVRPIFPGAMRFIAESAFFVPNLDEVRKHVQNGRINKTYLDTMQLQGTLQIRVQHSGHLDEMRQIGTIEALGESPTVALYGPIRLSSRFLRGALLDFNGGLLAGNFGVGGDIKPGDPDWEARALAGFLAGSYEPILRARDALEADDAALAPMPELVINADRSFTLGVAVGWLRDSRKAPVSVGDVNLEIIPTTAFLRHIAAQVRENVLDATQVDPLMSKIFENEDSSKPWVTRLTSDLKAIGFGALDDKLPLEQVIREFQICAARPIAATARDPGISPDKLALRHFGDLQATINQAHYSGPISGRANQGTRRAIRAWASNKQRCPLLITAYHDRDIGADERPQAGAVPAHADLWSRKETTSSSLRMFAADFTRLEPGRTFSEAELEPIGYYAPYPRLSTGGPNALKPTPALRVPYAEVTPERLIGVTEGDLLAALSPGAPADARAIASTFKVIRAVSECECLGYLDQINAYDDAGISYGPCHWTMAGAIKKPREATELGGIAAYFRYLSEGNVVPDVDVFAPQGLAAAQPPGLDAAAVARATIKASYIKQLCFIDDRGRPRPMGPEGPEVMIPSWRSFYRWVEIGRRHQRIGLGTWRMAVRRLHRLSVTPIILVPGTEGQLDISVTIGTAFTSEIVMAQLMRWHVKIPGAVVVGSGNKERASNYIVEAYKGAAVLASPTSGAAWAAALIQQLRVRLDAFIADTGTNHDRLDENFDEIANAPWIDESTKPPSVSNSTRGYGLDPRLRILSGDADSFRLAALGGEP